MLERAKKRKPKTLSSGCSWLHVKYFGLFSLYQERNLALPTCFNLTTRVVFVPLSGISEVELKRAVCEKSLFISCLCVCVCVPELRAAKIKGRISSLSMGHYEQAYLKRSLLPLTPSFTLNPRVTGAAEPPWSAC